MANPEHLYWLKQGVEAWNSWRKEQEVWQNPFWDNPYQPRKPEVFIPDLSGVALHSFGPFSRGVLLFPGINLRGANLQKATFVDVPTRILAEQGFLKADPTDLILNKADLTRADLRGINFSGQGGTRVFLYGAILDSTNLAGADLTGTHMGSTILADLDLREVEGLEEIGHFGPSHITTGTLSKSEGRIPTAFLRGCGLSDWEIEMSSLYSPARTEAETTDLIYRLSAARGTKAIQFYSCFISYAHADKQFARLVYERLQAAGIRCWLDEKQLQPGRDIYDEIDHGIQLRDKVLLCCSKRSLTSWWVDNEIGVALEKEQRITKEQGRKILAIVPLNLDGYLFSSEWNSGYRHQIRRRVAADFTAWNTDPDKFEHEMENLICALVADDRRDRKSPLRASEDRRTSSGNH
jgi:uncharacterized protein YjbI with pentapeptide repeats